MDNPAARYFLRISKAILILGIAELPICKVCSGDCANQPATGRDAHAVDCPIGNALRALRGELTPGEK